jgi:polyhydroxybutyrate depolymerase
LVSICVVAGVVACSDDGVPAAESDGGGSTGNASSGTAASSEGAATTLDGTLTGVESTGASEGPVGDTTGAAPMGTAGCGTAASPGLTPITIDVGGVSREYLLSIPEGYDPATPLPLVFAWHGLGSTHQQAKLYFRVEEASDGGAVFVYPQGLPLEAMGGQSGWDLAPEGIDMAFFDAMLAATQDTLCIDAERVFSTGHSFGGYMSNALGCFRASVLRAIGEVAGGPPFGTCEEGEHVAAMLIHGSLDEIVPLEQGETARDEVAMRNGCADTGMPRDPEPCVARDDCMPGYDVWWCQHDIPDLMGHTWPGWAGSGIWEFFAAQTPEQ